ncbi:DNA polymerase IV [Propionibacteriaceae bacterium Y2011]|uniref:DNA polymerase IV n=1 Tax=Microlunatus sp. Y2014 TaxID=3418488 RepID=UPI003B4ACB4F
MAVIMHVDMDAFFAMVELRDRPDLRGKPMIVGGHTRGVVLSATYEARAHGVRSGMPMTRARRLSPTAVVLPPRHDGYAAVSKSVFAILDTYSHVVEPASVDEAFLDITGSLKRLGRPSDIGEMIRAQVFDEQQVTCSVGIGPTKFIAKLASQACKPDGLMEVPPDKALAFLHPLPVERMWGVGEATAEKLNRFGLRTVADLAYTPLDTLTRAFGQHQGRLLNDLAWGRDPRPVVPHEPERSIGSSETFGRDTDDPAEIRRELLRMAEKTAARLRKAEFMARTVVLTVRFADFTTITRSGTMSSPTDIGAEIHQQAVALYEKLGLQRARIRLVGVRVEGLVPLAEAHRQPQLDEPEHGWREAEQAIDAAVAKFGPQAVQRATLARRRPGYDDPPP